MSKLLWDTACSYAMAHLQSILSSFIYDILQVRHIQRLEGILLLRHIASGQDLTPCGFPFKPWVWPLLGPSILAHWSSQEDKGKVR